jgi:hypothetical protein
MRCPEADFDKAVYTEVEKTVIAIRSLILFFQR